MQFWLELASRFIYIPIRCIHSVFGREITKYTVIYSVYTCGTGQPYTNTQCINGVFGREITKYTVIYSVYIRFWPTLHIYAVYKRCFWQGNHHTYGHIRCIYTVLANPTHIRSVCKVFLAGKSPSIRSYTLYIYGSGQPYTNTQCINGVFGRETTKYTVIYGECIHFWPTLHT
jgi:hypothetical protein